METAQAGRILENLVENAYTVQSGGRLQTYTPVLDAHGVDRALSLDGGPALFLQVKGHQSRRRDGRLSFAIPLTGAGGYPRWVCALVAGTADGLVEAYLVPGPELLRRAERGRLVDGRPCLRLTASRGSPTWGGFNVAPDGIGARLMEMAAAPEPVAPPPVSPAFERSQEEGRAFELAVAAALLGGSDLLALYQPAPDIAGRDLLVQLAGRDRHLYVQVKGTERTDSRPGLVRFQVRRRTFAADQGLLFLFAWGHPGVGLSRLWAVPAPELVRRAAAGDPEHISFEAHVDGPDARWAEFRTSPADLAVRVLGMLEA